MKGNTAMRRALSAAIAIVTTATVMAVPAPGAAGAESLGWGACPPPDPNGFPRDPRMQCATLLVPQDYRRPNGPQITITVSRILTADPGLRRGILLSNPGGPGGPGLDLPGYLAANLPAEVLARYDLIGFDPRGVGASTPITCGIPLDTPVDLILPYPAPDGSITRNVVFARTTAGGCAGNTGALLPHITTANTARDMDRIRAALGESKLSYIGYSYGTYLGAVYVSLFPQKGDRILLDSAVDPRRIWYNIWRQFSPAVELRLPDFTGWAARRDDTYHLGATPQAVRDSYFRIAGALDRQPVEIPGVGLVSGNLFREITRSFLYDDRLFPLLAEIWAIAAAGGAPGPDPALPPSDNAAAVLYSIACNDIAWSRDVTFYARNVAVDRRQFLVTAGEPANIWPCAFWPSRPVEPPVPVTSQGPRNVLILQNLRDPATSWASGFGLRIALGRRAAFVTVDAGGHGIYAIRSGPCTDAIGTRFLTSGVLPARDRFCIGPSPEDVTAQTTSPGAVPGRWPHW